jgi:predicted RNA-binding protein
MTYGEGDTARRVPFFLWKTQAVLAVKRSGGAMAGRNYWLDLFTAVTWQEFLEAGGKVSGFRESRWSTLQKVKPGDYFLCYVTGISRWIGVLEVTSEAFRDTTTVWKDESFPCRVKVKAVAKLTPETGVPVKDMKEQLSVFQTTGGALAWTGHFRGSPTKWKTADGEAVVKAVLQAAESPVVRPIDPSKLKYRPKALKTKIGLVTVPESDATEPSAQEVVKEPAAHTEIQWLLLKLGSDMGFSVWVARNDRNRSFDGHRFSELPAMKSGLPLQFDDATNRTIELIDVLWLDRNAYVAAFEIESTTSIYSGLLRMADLVAMQPNLNIPLFLVAPEERREKVLAEVNRPTFSRLDPKLAEICRYISFDALRERLARVKDFVRYLKPDFLEELSEACDLEQE